MSSLERLSLGLVLGRWMEWLEGEGFSMFVKYKNGNVIKNLNEIKYVGNYIKQCQCALLYWGIN